jgi:serine palmitoyltransferase
LKKGDLLVVDDACSEAIRTGCNLSRGTVVYFKHNNVADLRTILQSIADDDKRLKRNSLEQRRFIIVEGLYRLTGDICPLPEIMKLKEEFCYRLILDESLSFCVLGKTGRGLTELFGIDIKDIEVITVSIDAALGSVGGLCVGSHAIVDHQRLSGAGYCFSASPPPFFASAALAAIERMENDGEKILQTLLKNSQHLAKGIQKIPGFQLVSSDETPIMHLRLIHSDHRSWEDEEKVIIQFANDCVNQGVGVCAVKLQPDFLQEMNKDTLRPSVRICASSTLTKAEMDKAITTMTSVAKKLLK